MVKKIIIIYTSGFKKAEDPAPPPQKKTKTKRILVTQSSVN